jgi:hypothetical protein
MIGPTLIHTFLISDIPELKRELMDKKEEDIRGLFVAIGELVQQWYHEKDKVEISTINQKINDLGIKALCVAPPYTTKKMIKIFLKVIMNCGLTPPSDEEMQQIEKTNPVVYKTLKSRSFENEPLSIYLKEYEDTQFYME